MADFKPLDLRVVPYALGLPFRPLGMFMLVAVGLSLVVGMVIPLLAAAVCAAILVRRRQLRGEVWHIASPHSSLFEFVLIGDLATLGSAMDSAETHNRRIVVHCPRKTRAAAAAHAIRALCEHQLIECEIVEGQRLGLGLADPVGTRVLTHVSIERLQADINRLRRRGWRPDGSIAMVRSLLGSEYSQRMILPSNPGLDSTA